MFAALLWLLPSPVPAAPPPAQPGSSFGGKSLAQWQELYFRWSYGALALPTDPLGHAIVKNTILMPMPAAGGDGTPAQLDVTILPGQSFVLPLWNVLGTSYTDGTPNDPPIPMSVFSTLDIQFTINNQTVVGSANALNYYTEYELDPEVPLPENWVPYKNLVWAQGVGLVHPPLPPGNYVLKLDVKNTQPVVDAKGYSWVYEYHNTWNLKVGR